MDRLTKNETTIKLKNDLQRILSKGLPAAQIIIRYIALSEYEDTGLTPDEIKRLQKENAELQSKLSKAVEIFQLATENIHEISSYYGICRYCNSYIGRCARGYTVNCSFCNDWEWKHAAAMRELMGGSENDR